MKSISQYINWLWKDDKTGKSSDTTRRTWMIFFLFFASAVYLMFFVEIVSEAKESILNLLSLTALGQGGLYLGKRVNEKRFEKTSYSEFYESVEENIRRRSE